MKPVYSDTSYSASNWWFYRTGGGLYFTAPVTLPTGALLTGMSVDVCDTNPTAEVVVYLIRKNFAPDLQLAQISTGATPGCARLFSNPIAANLGTIDNNNFDYFLLVGFTGTNSTTRVGSVRVAWKRQVSAAPGTATFGDVPVGSPYHRFVEALLASEITAGCGNGNYCPDAPLTRGQMAVFLAAALGLHFPQ
jgi:hypothetical protein